MSTESEECLAELCASLQYLVDRGETSDINGAYNLSPVQAVRYTSITQLPFVDVHYKGRMIRLEATDLGPHVHKYNMEGTCEGCGNYNEDYERTTDDDAIIIQARRPQKGQS